MTGIGRGLGIGLLSYLAGGGLTLYYWIDNLGNNMVDNFGNKIVFNSEA